MWRDGGGNLGWKAAASRLQSKALRAGASSWDWEGWLGKSRGPQLPTRYINVPWPSRHARARAGRRSLGAGGPWHIRSMTILDHAWAPAGVPVPRRGTRRPHPLRPIRDFPLPRRHTTPYRYRRLGSGRREDLWGRIPFGRERGRALLGPTFTGGLVGHPRLGQGAPATAGEPPPTLHPRDGHPGHDWAQAECLCHFRGAHSPASLSAVRVGSMRGFVGPKGFRSIVGPNGVRPFVAAVSPPLGYGRRPPLQFRRRPTLLHIVIGGMGREDEGICGAERRLCPVWLHDGSGFIPRPLEPSG